MNELELMQLIDEHLKFQDQIIEFCEQNPTPDLNRSKVIAELQFRQLMRTFNDLSNGDIRGVNEKLRFYFDLNQSQGYVLDQLFPNLFPARFNLVECPVFNPTSSTVSGDVTVTNPNSLDFPSIPLSASLDTNVLLPQEFDYIRQEILGDLGAFSEGTIATYPNSFVSTETLLDMASQNVEDTLHEMIGGASNRNSFFNTETLLDMASQNVEDTLHEMISGAAKVK